MSAVELPPGARIGPYRIVSRVGAGGMGVVYKGWDPRLERDVAIKLLHPELAGDADRQRRLVAEGRAASALNHPNILRVYDADVDGDSYYLVSEWLEGKSLRDELARGMVPIKRLLDLAVQIADGLAAAHAAGIVHRDIKPENVMLARDGTARIVDFGLARVDPKAPGLATVIGQASTVTASLDGGLSGTPAYMSPEQARGTAGDFRTDQFSFGALLYEMATGRHAFRRDTMADTLAAVLHDEPTPIAEINPRVPVPCRWIIEQCLAKEAHERYAATEDLARELRRVRERLREAHADVTATTPRGRPWLPWIVAAATVSLAAMAVAASIEPDEHLRFTPIATAAQYEGTPVWSPDGQSLAWVADVDGVLQVFVRRLSDAVATQVTRGRFDAEQPFWAPDGQALYFISRAGSANGLFTVSSTGGRADLLIENVNHAAIEPGGAYLSLLRLADDSTVFQQLWWATANGQDLVRDMREPFRTSGFGLGGQLLFRPDGRELLFWAFTDVQRPGEPVSQYYLVPSDREGAVRTVLTAVTGRANLQPVSWLPDNRHVVIDILDDSGQGRHLWIADTRSRALRRLTATHTNETWPSVSPDGRRIAYASEEVDFDLVGIADDGQTRRALLTTARNEMDPAWAPAGDQFAFVTDRAGAMEVWLRSRDGQWERPLVTADDFGDARTDTFGALAFSPDGRTLAFQRRGLELAVLWLIPTVGGAPVRLLTERDDFNYQDAPTWSPDGEWVAFTRSNGPQFSLAKVRRGTTAAIPLLDRVVPFTRSSWSPDGRWIVCETFDGMVRVPADGGPPEPIFDESLLAYIWAPDSRRIIALAEAEAFGHISLIEIDTATGNVRTLNPDLGTIPVANQPIRGLSHVPGQGYLTSIASARSDIWLLEGFRVPGGLRDWWRGLFRGNPMVSP